MNTLKERSQAFVAFARTQPGCTPYDNLRPLHVRKHSAGKTLQSILEQVFPFSDAPERLPVHLERGLITVDGRTPTLSQKMVAGNAIHVMIPNTVEPPIAAHLAVLYEDEDVLVVNKPAPLPVHPCGRFNRNSLILIARKAWPDLSLKPVHRLDVGTTGVLALAKTKAFARALMKAFAEQQVEKHYVARVHGVPSEPRFSVSAPIEPTPSEGGRRRVRADGQPAITNILLEQVFSDGTSLLRMQPRTGRTNQIRLHLQHAGLPIVGDAMYGHRLAESAEALHLHAHQLIFEHPGRRERMRFEAPLPEYLLQPRGPSQAASPGD